MSRKLLLGSVLAGATILAWFASIQPKRAYRFSVSQFVAHPILDEMVRVEGTLVRGSLCKRSAPCEYRFRMTNAWPASQATELSVSYKACLPPDAFREDPGIDMWLLVEGEQCSMCHAFVASQLALKADRIWHLRANPPPSRLVVPECAEL